MMCVARIKKIEAANNLLVTAAQMQIIIFGKMFKHGANGAGNG